MGSKKTKKMSYKNKNRFIAAPPCQASSPRKAGPPCDHIFGLVPKNICASLKSCRTPEQCCQKNLFHPKWACEMQICVLSLFGKCMYGDDKCKKRHVTWDQLKNIVIGSDEKYAEDYFTNKPTK